MIDNLGRNIDSGLNAQDLRGLIESLAKQNTGPAKPFGKKNENDPTTKLLKDMETLSKDFRASIQETKKLTTEVSNFLKSNNKSKGNANNKLGSTKPIKKSSGEKKLESSMTKLAEEGLKKGSIKTYDFKVAEIMKSFIKSMKLGFKTMTGGGGGGPPGGGGGGGGYYGGYGREDPDQLAALNALRRKKQSIGDISRSLAVSQETMLGYTAFSKVTDGIVKKEREFSQSVRAVAYETEGVTKNSRSLQKTYEDIGKVSKMTGFERDKTQASYISNLKKGFKNQKAALDVSKSQLNTEKMIGVEAGALGETFSGMALSAGMTGSQLAQFGRSIQEAARNTGVTGENLANAVKQSDQFIKNLRNGARLTTEAASNMVELMASAEKFGVSEQMGSIAGVATKGLSGLMEASAQQKTLLYQAAGSMGATSELISGTLLSTKDGLKKLAGGMENILGKFGIESLDQIANMSDQQKSIVDAQLRAAYGMGLGEFKQSIEATKEASKGLDEKLSDITAKQKQNLTLGERNLLLDQKRSLTTGGSLNVMSKFSEDAKTTGTMAEALEKFGSKLPSMAKDLKALGVTATDARGALKQSTEIALKSVNEGLKKAGKKQLNITPAKIEEALKDGTGTAFRELESTISNANAELGVKEKSQVDALSDVNQSLNELNDTLRATSLAVIGGLLNQSGLAKVMTGIFGGAGGIADIMGKATDYQVNKLEAIIYGTATTTGAGGGTAASAIVAALPTIAATAAILVGIAGGIAGSIAAGEQAAEIFQTSQEKLTTAEFYAAKGAGAVTGALNYLTFGIFDSLLGSTGTLTIALAKFNKMIPILSVVMGIIDAIAGAIWGVITTIGDVLMGVGELVYYTLEPFGIILSAIGDVIYMILNPIFDFNATLGDTGSLFNIFSKILGGVGKAIRFVLKAVGMIIGNGLVRPIANTIAYIIKVIGSFVSFISHVFGPVFEVIYDIGFGIAEFFEGLLTFDLSRMTQAIFRVFWAPLQMVLNIVNGIVTWATNLVRQILAPFTWLYDVLVGHSIIPDLATAIAGIFSVLAWTVIAYLTGLPGLAMKAMSSLSGILTNSFNGVKSVASQTVSLTSNLFSGFIKGFSGARQAQEGFFSSVKKGFLGMKGSSAAATIASKTSSALGAGKSALNAAKNSSAAGKIGGILSGAKGKAGKLLSGAGSIFSSLLGGGGEDCPCSAETADALSSPLNKGMKNLGKQNAKGMEKMAGKSSKGFIGGLKSRVDSGIKSGKGLVGGLFGKAGGATSKVGGLLNKGTGLMSGLFGKASGVATKAGSLFSKSGGLMGSMFGKAGGFIAKAGLGGVGKSLLKKLPFMGAVAGAGFALSALVQGDVGGAVKELASGLAGAIPFIGPVLSAGIDFFGDGLVSGAGQLASSAWEGAKSIASSAWEGAKNLGSTLWEGTKNLGSKLWEGAKTIGEGAMWLGQKYIDGWKMVGKTALTAGKFALDVATLPTRTLISAGAWAGGKIAGFFGGANKAAETGAATANKMSMPSPVYPLNNVAGAATASTARTTDIGTSIQREAATADSAIADTAELSTIAESGQTQVEKLESMITLLQQMSEYMKPSQSSGGGGQAAPDTLSNSIAGSPPNYHKWKSGKHSQGPSLGVTNIGMS